ncbi:MAG TPA: response regulator [Flavobacteriaceae bacterium]|nr:response regulator [Flavobacteriaceae bacterium]
MLKEYKQNYAQSVNQYIIVDIEGQIQESDDVIFTNLVGKHISTIHPFFESLSSVLKEKNQDLVFSCIHLKDEKNNTIITDIIVKTFDDKQLPLIVILDLTVHYNNYQTTAQVRNESIINSQILELKNEYLKEKEAFKNAFIANFSHELRDPLSGILTFSDILKKTGLNDEQHNYLRVLDSSTYYLKQLIEDILDISKIESGKTEIVVQPFNLPELLNEIAQVYKAKSEQKGLEFITEFNDNLPKIIGGDKVRLRQVLSNFLSNAIKFTEEGSVTFKAELNQTRARKANINFEVKDTGIGISKEDQDAIFESFKQLNTSHKYKGSGLGLAIAKHFVELSGSTISVNSKLDKGSSFSTNLNFRLDPTYKLKKEKSISLETVGNKKYNILLVDDSEITQLSVLKILASKGSYFLDIVSQGQDVIPKVTNFDSPVDLILLDIKLPDINGDEVAKQIRKLPEREHKKIPIIALTAKVFKEDLKRYKKAGINDVLKKPFNEEELITIIQQNLK